MSFGGGFGGFGQNNNNTGGGFGGFGSNNNNTTSGFGSSGFGSTTNTSSNIFGGGNTGGSGFGGFGSNNNTNTSFGAKPFGGTGTNLFGGSTSASGSGGFGGFGSSANNTTSGFGSTNTGTGLFGASKPAFGSSTTGTGGMFGGGTTGGGFGSTNTTSGFGASTTGGFGTSAQTPPNNGTVNPPFTATIEKDAAQTQHFQTITFQGPYEKYSLEELRKVDYMQGRQFGNQNGQAGAFGRSTGFGGFGTTNTNTSTGFGTNTNTTAGSNLFGGSSTGTGFGSTNTGTGFSGTSNTGSNIFGGNKPGGLFGGTATSQHASTPFGGSTTTPAFGGGGTGFGATNTNTGSTLFGSQNQNQNKPFGGFGTSTTTTTPAFGSTGTTGFGQTNTSTGLFGQNNQTSAAPAFGSTPSATNTGGGVFGGFGQNQQNQTQPASAGLFGGGGFGQNQQNQTQNKPNLFGGSTTSNTGTSLFGQQNNQTQQSGGLFGGGNTQNQGTSLFGANKPATGTSLFGSSTTGNTTSGSNLFGNLNTNNQQQNQGTSLFGQQNQQKPLFGGSTTTTNNAGTSLFGNLGQNNTTSSTLGGTSLFGSQNQQPANQQSQSTNGLFSASGNSVLQTSLNVNPYGHDALFAGLSTPTQSPGPLATPLSSNNTSRKSAILPQHKLNPAASTRLLTPQRKTGGFGFTYSTYGTPNSASSSTSPGLASSFMGGGSLSRSLGRSLSTSNLRNSFTPDTSILAPGAFAQSSRSFAGGSLKKLNVNRSINTRTPLFGNENEAPSQATIKKTVSFDRTVPDPTEPTTNGSTSTALVRTKSHEAPEDVSPARTSPFTMSGALPNGSTNGTSSQPEMQEVNGVGLSSVPENGAPLGTASSSSLNAQKPKVDPNVDPQPGQYWMSPSLDELKKMSQKELKSVPKFTVGRYNIGQIEFGMGKPVDLSSTPLDRIMGHIVILTLRNAAAFDGKCDVTKPSVGNGLNVPSRITLQNSWPRSARQNGKSDVSNLKITKHIERLKRVSGTHFEKYFPESGTWVFTVDHFSSYGLDDEDEDEDMDTSALSPPPDTPTQFRTSEMTTTPQESSFMSPSQSSPDDTFDFKKGRLSRTSLPGGFGEESVYDEGTDDSAVASNTEESFLGERSTGSFAEQQYADSYSESESVDDQDMAGSVSGPVRTVEHTSANEANPFTGSLMPKSILKASQAVRPGMGTPSKGPLVFDDDWANQLQRTISPKKQDREALRQSQGAALREIDGNVHQPQALNGPTITTSIDLMKSLFGEPKEQDMAASRSTKGIKLPYAKRPKSSNDFNEMSESDKDFHWCNKPHFAEDGTVVYTHAGGDLLEGGVFSTTHQPLITTHKDIRFTKLPTFPDASTGTFDFQKGFTKVSGLSEVPEAIITNEFDFEDFKKNASVDSAAGIHEQKVWELLEILFDSYHDSSDASPEDVERARKERLSTFWEKLVRSDADNHAQQAKTPEEKAIAYLSGHNIEDACHSLLEGLDLRLATLVSLIGGDISMRNDMVVQIEEWRRLDVLADMEEPIRALYELLTGNCGRCEGKIGDGRENKASTFCIASRFGLDWRRAFGLRLWYGILNDEPIELAVAQFSDALRYGHEDVKPVPWFVEQNIDMGWDDPRPQDREDLLWGILRLYASAKLDYLPANIDDILAPENVSGHPLNARLSFQLFHLFRARQKDAVDDRRLYLRTKRTAGGVDDSVLSTVSESTEMGSQAPDLLPTIGDSLSLTYASSLHTPEHWMTAAFVYTHLSSPQLREHYIRALLAFYSSTYEIQQGDEHYDYLTKVLQIPAAWIHYAAALRAKVDGDNHKQAYHLIEAGELEEAHEVLCRSVGPASVISRDTDGLRELLGGFIPTPSASPVEGSASFSASTRGRGRPRAKKDPVPGWTHGGQIYFDYIHLVDLAGQQGNFRGFDEETNKEVSRLLTKLQSSLEAIAQDRWESRGLEERVALAEIAGFVANLLAQKEHADRSKILKLPLTEDRWLKHTRELSLGYYRAVLEAV